jgi:hypothetical protein
MIKVAENLISNTTFESIYKMIAGSSAQPSTCCEEQNKVEIFIILYDFIVLNRMY